MSPTGPLLVSRAAIRSQSAKRWSSSRVPAGGRQTVGLRPAAVVVLRIVDVSTGAVVDELGERPVREIQDIAATHLQHLLEFRLLVECQIGHDWSSPLGSTSRVGWRRLPGTAWPSVLAIDVAITSNLSRCSRQVRRLLHWQRAQQRMIDQNLEVTGHAERQSTITNEKTEFDVPVQRGLGEIR
jgi:hypothetical protein